MDNLIGLVNKISESYALRNSMVDFIPGLLMKYACGEITRTQLLTEHIRQTKNAQFYFSHMPKEEIQASQRMFAKEFAFADQLTAILEKQPSADDEQVRSQIEKCMEDYLRSIEGT